MSVKILVEALPYIKEFYGSSMVIKIGGNILINDEILENIIRDILLLYFTGIKPVVVHGGGPEISEKMEKFGIKPKFVDGLRITDERTLEIVEMVLDGKINSKIVSSFIKNGGKAVGISCKDGLLIVARKKMVKKRSGEKEITIDLGLVGEAEYANPDLLEVLLNNGYIPVVSPIAADLNGNTYNLNADIVAGTLAGAIKAKKLIILTNVSGILKDIKDEKSVISKLTLSELEKLLNEGIIKGGMIPKAEAAIIALKNGVEKVHIINGMIDHSILLELFTDKGIGTMIVK